MTQLLKTLTISVLALTLGLLGGHLLAQRGGPNDTDLGFARDMQAHHLQAVEMSILANDHSSDPAVKLLAFDIESTQNNQVGQMRGWLEAWGKPLHSDVKPMTWMGDPVDSTSVMPGMATQDQMTALEDATGEDFDKEYLTLMYVHHNGALHMARDAQENAGTLIVRNFATKVYKGQAAEMENIAAMLQAKGAEVPELPSETGDHSGHMDMDHMNM